jgi:concanavalin A-like lectin/glucanase superfamily protein
MRAKVTILISVVIVFCCAGDVGAELVAQWRLDEGAGTDAFDDSGNGYNGTLMGDPTWVAGVFKGALELDGDGDFVDFGNPGDWPAGSVPRSLCGWGLTDSIASGYRWLAAYGSPGTGTAFFIGMNDQRAIGGGYNGDDVEVAGYWVTGEWHHLALTYDGTTARLYADGVEIGAQAKSWNLVLGRAHIGRQVNDAAEFWDGLVDEVYLFDHTLSVDEILDVMAGMNTELAGDPIPEDEAVDVPRDDDLSWIAGEFAATHDVYFGTTWEDVNAAGRADPRDVLISEGQSGVTYEPGRLEFGETYYWRIDEVNAAPDSTLFKGDVWSFTVEPLAYPIAGIVATSNGISEADAGPENLVNGSGLNAADQHSTASADMWLAVAGGADPISLEFAFDRLYKLHEMMVWNYNVQFELILGFGVKNVTVEYSEDGMDWAALGDVELGQGTAQSNYTANTTVDFGGVAAAHVRLVVNEGYGVMGQLGLSEVRFMQIPAHAREPEPADGATDVAVEAALGWRAGREAEVHEVYLSTDEAAVADGSAPAAEVAEDSYPLSGLDLQLGNTYYWKIDEVNEAEAISVWEGDVWSFATQAFIAIDDMESYDDEDNRIYDTWIDGFVNETGSTVGHLDAPFAETSIVHGGDQSMPLQFDNAGGVTTSEAELTLDRAQDWTGHGIQTLSLYFFGMSGNNGQLYVKIDDTKVVYDGDAADIGRALWQPWNIDLSSAGANLQDVTMLTVGIEGAGARGTIYVDDIRLYPNAPEFITPAEPDGANLVAHYALDGDATDGSGNGADGTAEGNPSYAAGVDGQAVLLDGVGDYLDFGSPANWPAGTSARTMTAWAKTSSLDAGWRWIAAYGTGSTGQAMFVGMNGTDLYGGGYGDDVMTGNFWVVDEWHHIGLTYDGITARLFADGIEVASGEKTWDLVLNRAHIGRQVNDVAEFWDGAVDEVRIYDGALSAEEIAWLAGRRVPVHKPL